MQHRWLSTIPSLHPAPIKPKRPPIPRGESSHVVYCDNEQEVMEGFAIALRAMGLG